jgi:hypothetical protein
MFRRVKILVATIVCLAGCQPGADTSLAPSDDPADYQVDTSIEYEVVASEPRWVVPSSGLPAEVEPMVSNANVDIIFFEDRLFMAWRSAPYHFASTETKMYIVSSVDSGQNWDFEDLIELQSDMREPRFLSIGDSLQLIFFQAGTDPLAFEPQRIWRTKRRAFGDWTKTAIMLDEPEVPWDLKVRNQIAYLTSYKGDHYSNEEDAYVDVFFKYSLDGEEFHLLDGKEYVYRGGVSEVAFEFDQDGSLWTVTRNEDGDATGFGSHVCVAQPGALAEWDCPQQSDPERYDSPDMFRHGDDIYLVARRDVGGPYDQGDDSLTFLEQRSKYLKDYSMRPKRTALYKIDKAQRAVVHLFDLPGNGDTAFPAVRRTGQDTFLLANYTSPLDDPDISWIDGQTSSAGTQLYLLTLSLVPKDF